MRWGKVTEADHPLSKATGSTYRTCVRSARNLANTRNPVSGRIVHIWGYALYCALSEKAALTWANRAHKAMHS